MTVVDEDERMGGIDSLDGEEAEHKGDRTRRHVARREKRDVVAVKVNRGSRDGRL